MQKLYNRPLAGQPAEALHPEKTLEQADALIAIILNPTDHT
jgi:hypothetical protein